LQLLTEQERWDYLRQQALSGQFDYQRQRQLAQADFQRLKFEQDARISGRVAIFESQVMAGCRKYLAPPSPLPQNEANELFSKRITDYDFIKKHSFGDPPALFKQQAFALEWGWSALDIRDDPDRLTYQKAVQKAWCTLTKDPEKLRRKFAEHGYREPYIVATSYYHLEELIAERCRQQAQRRQAKHRAQLSPEAKAEIRQKDRQRKRSAKALSVTENLPTGPKAPAKDQDQVEQRPIGTE